MRYRWMAVLGMCLSVACSRSPESALVRGAADAMGGASKILAVDTLTLEGSGENYNLGQNQSPASELPKLDVAELKRVIDFKGGRWRQEGVRTPTYLTGNPAPQRQVLGVAGDVAYNVSPTGTATRASARTASDRSAELYHHPVGILRAALAPQPALSNARKEGGNDVVDVSASGATYSLYLDESTKLPVKVVSKTSNPLLGDVLMETQFSDYAETDGLKLPTVITSVLDGNTVAVTRVSATTLNGEPGDLAAPAEAASAAADPPAAIEVSEAGKGIWYLTGQTHHSVLAEFSDHLVLIEVPNETRTLAVIAKARELRPDKPLTHAVVTHHHFDHSGGIRAAVSEGLTIIAQAGAADFIKDIVARPHTLEPDALQKNPKPLNLQTVDGELLLEDDSMKLALYPISGSPHADTLLMAHFPQEGGLLVEADVYSPPAPNAPPPPAFPFAANLAENIQERKLKIANLLPIHGRMVPMSEMMGVAVPAATSGE
jgi:glyoxylase-like metal-dependent hydrolase (beta-lactamase superfamily II)